MGESLVMFALGSLSGLAIGAGIAALVARAIFRSERLSAARRDTVLGAAQVQMRDTFRALSAEALQRNNRFFLELAQSSLGELHHETTRELEERAKAIDSLVKPVSESLQRVDRKLAEIEKERHGHYSELTAQLKSVSSYIV